MGGSSPVTFNSNNKTHKNCCIMSLKCWCRWRWDHSSSSLLFFLISFIFFASVSFLFIWVVFSPFHPSFLLSNIGCQSDNEGSWSIGVFFGDSPFNLKPIEDTNAGNDESAAWPIANPIITCATSSNAGFPSNFVARPFLFVEGDIIYVFYETKNPVTLKGDIGVSRSVDKGATWQHLGIALEEEWHLSYPYVFEYNRQIYLMPESYQKGELRLYRALEFPLQWTLDRVVMKKPLVDSSIVKYDGNYWLFGSSNKGFGTKTQKLEIWHSSSPLGPWIPHEKNPIFKYNPDISFGEQSGGKPFLHNGSLYRIGQDRGKKYGQRLRTFKVKALTMDEYKEVEVPLGIEESKKGRNAWNGVRYHHLDIKELGPNEWVGVMDGDRVLSGDFLHRYILGSTAFAGVAILVVLLGVLLGVVKCTLPLSWYRDGSGKRKDVFLAWERPHAFSSKMWRFFTCLNRTSSSFRGWMKVNNCAGRLILIAMVIIAVALMCTGVGYIYGGNGAEEAYPLKDHYSQFTLLTMTYEARLWNLKMYVKHYSRCSSVREIVVVWNKGKPPALDEFDSVVPVRIRVESQNSLNNRFKMDPLIKTRAVFELDDDIMMTCNDVERGFKVWRESPDRIVGFYPRLNEGSPLKYRNERYARSRRGYNMILTGAAFIDSRMAFSRYWSEEAEAGREVVDKFFNCEDVLLNYLYANASMSRTVEYVKPGWVIDMSKFSGVAISSNTKVHYQIRSECLVKFSEMYGGIADRKWKFNSRTDHWDA